VTLLLVLTVFQVALALGAPRGRASWGGRYRGKLPVGLRAAGAANALVVYPVAIVCVPAPAGVVDGHGLPGGGAAATWALVGFLSLGTLANLISRSSV